MSDKLPKTDLRSEVTIKNWGISKWEHGNAIVWQPTKRNRSNQKYYSIRGD